MGILDKISLIATIAAIIALVYSIKEFKPYFTGAIEGAKTTFCDYTSFIPNPACEAEPTVVTVIPDPVIIIPPPVVVPSTGNDIQCVDYRDPQGCGTHPYMNSQYESCLGVNVQDGECTCQVSQQCVQDIDQQTCNSQKDRYWELGQCKEVKSSTDTDPFIPLEDAIDDVTGEKVQDILERKFVEGGGDLQKCREQAGIIVGNYWSENQSDITTTCVPLHKPLVTSRQQLRSECQNYCSRNHYVLGVIDDETNTCVCDGSPQIHLSPLSGFSTAEVDKALASDTQPDFVKFY